MNKLAYDELVEVCKSNAYHALKSLSAFLSDVEIESFTQDTIDKLYKNGEA